MASSPVRPPPIPTTQNENLLSTPMRPSSCSSVGNSKANTQHMHRGKALFGQAHTSGIAEVTRVERIRQEGTQEDHDRVAATKPQPPATEVPTVHGSLKAKLDKEFKKLHGTLERSLYIPTAIILNELTVHWYKSQKHPPPFAIVHVANPDNPLPGDTYDTQNRPDIVSRRATLKELEQYLELLTTGTGERKRKIPDIDDLRPAHGEVVSTIELKLKKSHGASQSLSYCAGLMRYRLDQTIVFGMRTAQQSWNLWRLHPCSVLSTDKWYQWNDYGSLLLYIDGIHSAECIRDDTVEYVPGGGQMWTVRVKGVEYRVHPFFASHPLGRMTRVGVAYPTTWTGNCTLPIERGKLPDPAYIKLTYVSTDSRFREEKLLDQAHSDGYIPGLVRLVAHESRPFFVEGEHGLKQKETFVLGSGGEPLSQCKTAKELLMAIYDAIETLQAMAEQGVLHRDISRGNILCHPKHHYHEKSKPIKQRPYIEAMLTDDVPVSERVTYKVWSLVTDLGHSANMNDPNKGVGFDRTGTPMYVSGEIAGNPSLRVEPAVGLLFGIFTQIDKKIGKRFDDTFMSKLRELALNILNEQMERVQQEFAIVQGEAPLEPKSSPPPLGQGATPAKQSAPQHEPRHDIESVFWVLVCCLVRAAPGGTDNKPTGHADCVINDMLYHEIPPPVSNSRDQALKWGEEDWTQALHPKLQMLAAMIAQMCRLLCINWRIRSTPDNRFFLHQGFKRLLLMEIQEIHEKDVDVRLNTERPRKIYARKPEEVRKTVTDSDVRASGSGSHELPIPRIQRSKHGSYSTTDPVGTSSSQRQASLDHLTHPSHSSAHSSAHSSPRPPRLPQLPADAPEGPFLASEMEALRLGTEGTDDGQEVYERRSQGEVDKQAIQAINSMPEVVKKTILAHKCIAESLVKMHLDDEAWHRVTVKPVD